MRALVVPSPEVLELREISAPKVGPFEALVRIEGCGICATTDRELIRGRQPYHKDYPAVLGHEAIGKVVEVGARVSSFRLGDRVTRPAAIWPGETREGLASAWGGFAEYGVVRDRVAMTAAGDPSLDQDYTALRQRVIPEGLSLPDAILGISLSETASWFRYLPPVAGKTVCISGTGIAGLGMVLWSLLAGAAKIIVLGRRKERLDLTLKLGATHGINIHDGPPAAQVRALNEGRGADFFLEAVGLADQVRIGLSVLAPGGAIAIYGAAEGQRYDLSWGHGPTWANISQYPAEEYHAYPWVARLIERGIIPTRELMTHHWPLAQYQKAFAAADDGTSVKSWIDLS